MNNRQFFLFWLFPGCLVVSSCLSGISLDAPATAQTLVIEGTIRDTDSFYEVLLSTTSDRQGLQNNTSALTVGANIVIENSAGSSASFTEVGAGKYLLNASLMDAIPGEQYRLNIQLANSDQYETDWVAMPQPLPIQDGYAEFFQRTTLGANDVEEEIKGHDIVLEFNNPVENHYFKVEEQAWAEAFIGYGDCEPPPPNLTRCWHIRNPIFFNTLFIESNVDISTSSYRVVPTSIPLDIRGRYVALIQVDAMSASSFSYLSEVKSQLDRPGGLFDAPFSPIPGNIIPIGNAPEALGFFHAYSRTEVLVCIDRRELELTFDIPIDNFCQQRCIDIWNPGTYDEIADILCNSFSG